MADYFWSARFICGVLTVALGAAMLVGALLFLPYTYSGGAGAGAAGPSDVYFIALGAALCPCGLLLAARARAGLTVYAIIALSAAGWTLWRVGLDVWQLMPQLLALLLWGAILLTLRHRIAPTRDPVGAPSERLRRAALEAWQTLREHST
jgi:glucose dehydrogenase